MLDFLNKKAMLSGNANNGSNAGLSNFNSNNGVGNANANIRFRAFVTF